MHLGVGVRRLTRLLWLRRPGVSGDGVATQLASEAEYRAFGYEPDYDNLPWKENYDAAKGHEERFKH
jgi:surface antigen